MSDAPAETVVPFSDEMEIPLALSLTLLNKYRFPPVAWVFIPHEPAPEKSLCWIRFPSECTVAMPMSRLVALTYSMMLSEEYLKLIPVPDLPVPVQDTSAPDTCEFDT